MTAQRRTRTGAPICDAPLYVSGLLIGRCDREGARPTRLQRIVYGLSATFGHHGPHRTRPRRSGPDKYGIGTVEIWWSDE